MYIPKSSDYLDMLLKKSMQSDRKLRYDSDIAKKLDASPSTISKYRTGTNMSVLIAVKLAHLLEIEPLETISATMAWQAKTNEERDFWVTVYQRYKTP